MANMTLLDIARLSAGDDVVGMIEESIQAHPEISLGAARTISGTGFDSLVRTALPSVGFRSVNEGVATTKATYALRRSNTFLVDASSEVDEAMGQASEDGLDANLATEMSAKVEAAMRSLASQFYYGTVSTVGASSSAASAAKGFPGIVDLYDTTNMEVDGAGSSGTYTSVWMVKFGPQYVQWLAGQGGLFNVGETKSVRLTDGSSNPYDGLRKALTFWVGLHSANPRNSMVRIKKLDTSATLTDAMLDQSIEKFPGAIVPDVCLMTKRSLRQLKSSRTATNPTGAPATWPTEVVGLASSRVPILTTDAISETETS